MKELPILMNGEMVEHTSEPWEWRWGGPHDAIGPCLHGDGKWLIYPRHNPGEGQRIVIDETCLGLTADAWQLPGLRRELAERDTLIAELLAALEAEEEYLAHADGCVFCKELGLCPDGLSLLFTAQGLRTVGILRAKRAIKLPSAVYPRPVQMGD